MPMKVRQCLMRACMLDFPLVVVRSVSLICLGVATSLLQRLITDELNVYIQPGQALSSHKTVEHGKGEYVRGDAHINTAEDYFSPLKRSIDGTHIMSQLITCIAVFLSLIIAT